MTRQEIIQKAKEIVGTCDTEAYIDFVGELSRLSIPTESLTIKEWKDKLVEIANQIEFEHGACSISVHKIDVESFGGHFPLKKYEATITL